jgi:hypothetical protein
MANGTSFVPTRLLDTIDQPSGILRLVMGEALERSTPYVTLSHRWGDSNIERLLHSNLEQYQVGVSCDHLPRTFVEAIEATRRLGFRYLWIDSLCIIQDSEDDWQRESGLMENVYGDGALNIMASASANSHGGLFRARDPRDLEHCAVTVHPHHPTASQTLYIVGEDMWENSVARTPLTKRGWVLQERLLSPRSLHFSSRQLFWECRTLDACEMYPSKIPDCMSLLSIYHRVKVFDFDDYKILVGSNMVHTARFNNSLHIWSRTVYNYSRMSLTRLSDKLVAISGLAKRYRALLRQDKYLAGLWMSQLPAQLLWYTRREPQQLLSYRPPEYRAPSWSWASIEGPIWMINDSQYTPFIEVQEARVIPAPGHDDTGQLASGYIRLRGTLFEVEISKPDEGSSYHSITKPDTDFRVRMLPDIDLSGTSSGFCLPICALPGYNEPHRDQLRHTAFLVLESATDSPAGYYRRLGVAEMPRSQEPDARVEQFVMDAVADSSRVDSSLYLSDSPGVLVLV